NIVYLDGNKNSDGTLKMGRCPTVFDFSGLAILSNLENPADDNSIVFEVNSKQDDLDINKPSRKDDSVLLDENKNIVIELNELDINDIATLIENGFNRKFNNENPDSECHYYYIHKFYPTNSTFVMKSWGSVGDYYKSSYFIENSKVIIGDIKKVEESWEPIDGSQPIEVNSSLINILNNQKKEEESKMDEKIVLELNQKIEDKINEVNTLSKSLEEASKSLEENQVEINTLIEKIKVLEEKETELNTTIVEVNKLLEVEKAEKESLTVEVNSFREEKAKTESEAKIAEVNTYFETEISKNGFEEAEINSLKSFVESVDLEGLKKAEAELCAKKFKEMIAEGANVEVNTKNDMFIAVKQKEKKVISGSVPSFFN
ncbi:MAG: hypothetical protein PHX62_04140, partial [Bacilli bacterium]|nr:hypothetical protein [Bacilli bacterium]